MYPHAVKQIIQLSLGLLVLSSLQACEWWTKPSYLHQQMRKQQETSTQFADYPRFKLSIYKIQRSASLKNKYVFGKVDDYLQDQMTQHQDYSDAFYLQQLKPLPPDLSASFASHYLERELKIDGFGGYFLRSRGFMAPQALQAYRQQGFSKQADLLTAANLIYIKQNNTEQKKLNTAAYQSLDQAWKQAQPALFEQRAKYFDQHLPDWIAQEPKQDPEQEPQPTPTDSSQK